MSTLALWSLAKPWTADEWAGIVNSAQTIGSLRKLARDQRRLSTVLRRSGLGDQGGALQEAMRMEWKARGLEARIRRNSEGRGGDLDAAAVARFAGD
jgi:hypothetical protein